MQNGLLVTVALALLSSLAGGLLYRHTGVQRAIGSLLLACSGIGAVLSGMRVLLGGQEVTARWPLGLPWLHWQWRLDGLAACFFLMIGLVTIATAIYAFAYNREYHGNLRRLSAITVFTGLFVAGMQLVVLADDAYAFMVAWELMSLSSYFLVATEYQHAATRRAAFLYLLMAQISGIAILLSFGVLAAFSGSFAFGPMRAGGLTPVWSSIAFALALFGFGTKAGLVPMHGWLPHAHPIAPSPISALLSAAIVKVALYGFVRITFDILDSIQAEWGVATMIVGAVTALYGVLYALMQTDLKRLLAYSTVENMGVLFMALGLSMLFIGKGFTTIGALALVAALFHALNHACFKGLLFLGAGAVRHVVHSNELNHMGGLIHLMPWTALLFLFGALSISSLPPLNGFASEWLMLQAALQAVVLDSGVLRATVPVIAATLVLTAALSATAFVKAYGTAFLGRPRSDAARRAHEVPISMRVGQVLLALLCLGLGVLPTLVVATLQTVPRQLLGQGLPSAARHGWLWLTPVSPERASYAAPLVFVSILAALLVWLSVNLMLKRRRRQKPVPRVPPWDCGFGSLNARMQYSAESFSMPVQRIFQPLFDIDETSQSERGDSPGRFRKYVLVIADRTERLLYQPIARILSAAARRVGALQTGHLHHYLLYSFLTLVLLLWLIR